MHYKTLDELVGHFEEQLQYDRWIRVLDQHYIVQSTSEKWLNYCDLLFYPEGANGIAMHASATTAVNPHKIQCIETTRQKVDALIEETVLCGSFLGFRRPQWKGIYSNYKYEHYNVYIQPYDDSTSTAHIIVQDHENFVLIASAGHYASKALSRHIRELAVRLHENAGDIIMHASLVDYQGKGILIVGESGAGKTTVALSLCKYLGAKLIANDRVLVKHCKSDGKLHACAFAFPIRLNYGTLITLEAEAAYKEWKLLHTLPSENSDWTEFDGKEKLHILPGEANMCLGIELAADTVIDIVLEPHHEQNINQAGLFPVTSNNTIYSNVWNKHIYNKSIMEDI